MSGPTPLPENAPSTSFSAARALHIRARDPRRRRSASGRHCRARRHPRSPRRAVPHPRLRRHDPAHVRLQRVGDLLADRERHRAHSRRYAAGRARARGALRLRSRRTGRFGRRRRRRPRSSKPRARFATNTSAIRSSTSSPMPRRSRCWGRKDLWPIRSCCGTPPPSSTSKRAARADRASSSRPAGTTRGWRASIAHALPRPATSSLYYDIYELLPNDTDLTVFKRAGLAGVGFAHIGRPVHYHTPLDNFANVTPSTVQHHGDHMLAMARALAGVDLRQTSAATRSGSTCCRSSSSGGRSSFRSPSPSSRSCCCSWPRSI